MASARLTDKIIKASMIFQLAICNILGFGTSMNIEKAMELISQAKVLGHPIAEGFGQLVCSGISVSENFNGTYNACIISSMQAALVPILNGNELLHACSVADKSTAISLINSSINTAEVTEDGCSALHWLFIFGQEAFAMGRRILAQWHDGYPLISPDSDDDTPVLDRPCYEVRRLHPQWPLEFCGTPLAFAICADSITATKALLDLGANPLRRIYDPRQRGSTYPHSWTPFHLAACLHRPEILKLLLRATKININTLNDKFNVEPLGCALPFSSKLERYAIHGRQAAKQRLKETVLLLTYSVANQVSTTGRTPLLQAIDFEDIDVVWSLITCYPQLVKIKFQDPTNPKEWNLPIHFAAQLAGNSNLDSSIDILALLVEHDPHALSATDSKGRLPLHLAVTGRSPKAAKWLIEHGSDVNTSDNNGSCPMHYVSAVDTAELLLSAGALLDPRDSGGLSPLHYLCRRDNLDVFTMIVERGAAIRFPPFGRLLHFAIYGLSRRMVSAVLALEIGVNECNEAGETSLHLATEVNQADIVQLLLETDANRNIADAQGRTPLHIACSLENTKIVQILLDGVRPDSGGLVCDVNAMDICQRSPMHLAAKRANVTLAKLLLQHGASVLMQDDQGRLPLHVTAQMMPEDTSPEVNHYAHRDYDTGPDQLGFCELLLEHKEALLIPDKEHRLAWQLAWDMRNFKLLSLLFSEKYSSAGVQLAFASAGAALEVMNAALKADAIYLLEALVAQRETVRSQLPQYQVDVFDRIVTNVTDRRRGHLYLESTNIFGPGRRRLYPNETARNQAELRAAVEAWKRR